MVKKESENLNKNELLFKVTIFLERNSNKSVMLFSLSHLLGDGFTFYKILSDI